MFAKRREIEQKDRQITAAAQAGGWSEMRRLLAAAHDPRVRKSLETLSAEVPRSVGQLAKEVNLGPDHLQRLFKQETGQRLSDVLAERRLTAGAHLLITTQKDVKEIAFTVGYSHQSSFVRAFRHRFHQSPTEYRAARRKMLNEIAFR